MNRLVRLYPRRWRERYRDEYDELITSMSAGLGRYGRARLALDVVRGAFDAHLQRRAGMRKLFSDPPVRRGVLDGLVVAAAIAVVLFLSNVVFPKGPDESDSDPEYLVQLAAAYLLLFALLVAIGVHARWRTGSPLAGIKGGVAAAVAIVLVLFVGSIVVDNVWLSVVSQQHDKRMAFARSGFSSMQLFLNLQNLEGLFVITPVGAFVGGLLGGLGGLIGTRWAGKRATAG
jgi:hypothetical protein